MATIKDEAVFDEFRRWGYLAADLDPLGYIKPLAPPELAHEGEVAADVVDVVVGTKRGGNDPHQRTDGQQGERDPERLSERRQPDAQRRPRPDCLCGHELPPLITRKPGDIRMKTESTGMAAWRQRCLAPAVNGT